MDTQVSPDGVNRHSKGASSLYTPPIIPSAPCHQPVADIVLSESPCQWFFAVAGIAALGAGPDFSRLLWAEVASKDLLVRSNSNEQRPFTKNNRPIMGFLYLVYSQREAHLLNAQAKSFDFACAALRMTGFTGVKTAPAYRFNRFARICLTPVQGFFDVNERDFALWGHANCQLPTVNFPQEHESLSKQGCLKFAVCHLEFAH